MEIQLSVAMIALFSGVIGAAISLGGVGYAQWNAREIAREQRAADLERDRVSHDRVAETHRREELRRVYAAYLSAAVQVAPLALRVGTNDGTTDAHVSNALTDVSLKLQEVFVVGSPTIMQRANDLFLTVIGQVDDIQASKPMKGDMKRARGAYLSAVREELGAEPTSALPALTQALALAPPPSLSPSQTE